jgi:hypothetical protein
LGRGEVLWVDVDVGEYEHEHEHVNEHEYDYDYDHVYRLITSSSGQSEAEWILQVPFWALFQGTFGAPA